MAGIKIICKAARAPVRWHRGPAVLQSSGSASGSDQRASRRLELQNYKAKWETSRPQSLVWHSQLC